VVRLSSLGTSRLYPQEIFLVLIYARGRDSSFGIATGYGLEDPGIESRWGARFFAHVQTGPGAHPASCTMGTGSFPGVKRPGRGADHPLLLAPRSGKSRAIPLPPLWAFGPVTGYLYSFLLEAESTPGPQCGRMDYVNEKFQ
jgi:hypothetical protein